MIKPTIHLNGSSPDRLLDGYTNAVTALTDALEALVHGAPNGRDYYPQGDDAFRQAAREHASRVERLTSVLTELSEIGNHVSDEKDARDARRNR